MVSTHLIPGSFTRRVGLLIALFGAVLGGVATISPGSAEAAETLRDLVKQFETTRSKPNEERIPILQAIGKIEGPEASRYLEKVLTDGGKDQQALRETLVWILADRGDPAALETVITKGFEIFPEEKWGTIEQAFRAALKPEAVSWLVETGFKIVPNLKPRAQKIVLGMVLGTHDPRSGVVGQRLLGNRKIRAANQALLVDLVRLHKVTEATKNVNKMFRYDNPELQIAVLRTLRDFNAQEYSKTFKDAIESRHWEVRVLAADIFGGTHDPAIVHQITPLLEDPFPQVQLAAIQALRKIGGREVIQPLIDAMLNAPGRVRDDIADTLLWLTGQDLGPDQLGWTAWWTTNGASVEVKGITREEFDRLRKKTEGSSTGTYYGLRVISEYVTFIVDTSGSMQEPYLAEVEDDEAGKKRERDGGTKVKPRPGEKGKKKKKDRIERKKIEVAREQLTRAMNALKDGVQFNLISFDRLFTPWQPALIEMDDLVREQVLLFIENLNPGGTTNIFDTLIAAFEDTSVDTIYFLSDGAPTAGAVTDTEEICRRVRELNDIRKVKIHTIGFHLDPNAEILMRRLAEENYGNFVKR